MTAAIRMTGIRKTFGPKVAVDRLDLTIPEGTLTGFIGPNGAGKTTTIRMVMSIIFPDSGELEVLGRKSAFESKDLIGYLPEERGLYRKMRVGAFLEYMAGLKGVPRSEAKRRVRQWLDRVELADCIKKKCEELSKGMQQKVQFVAAVIHDPRLIILDEPFSGLDPVNARLMRELIDEMHHRGKTIIFSTHVMSHAERICDHVVMIHRGRKVLDSSMHEIRTRYDPRTIVFEPVGANGVLTEGGSADVVNRASLIDGVEAVVQRDGAFEASIRVGANPREVMAGLFAAIPLTRIELHRPTLEDIFIEIVQGKTEGDGGGLRASLRAEGAVEATA